MRYGFSSPLPETVENDMSETSSISSDSSFELISPEPPEINENEMTSSFKPSVSFCEMFDVYPVDSDIIARISHDESFEPTPDDTVIVVPLAWTSVEQALCTAKTNGNYIKFDTKELPNTTDQFYQLCYCFTKNRTVMGVSIPFSFREVHEDQLMEFQREHNKEFWTFRSRFAVLMDIYWNSLVENKKVNPSKNAVEEEENAVAIIESPQKFDSTERPNIECSDPLIKSPVSECSDAELAKSESHSLLEVGVNVEAEVHVEEFIKNQDNSSSLQSETEIPYIDLTTSNDAVGTLIMNSEEVKRVNSSEKYDQESSSKEDGSTFSDCAEMLDAMCINSSVNHGKEPTPEKNDSVVSDYCTEMQNNLQRERRVWDEKYHELLEQYQLLEKGSWVLRDDYMAIKAREQTMAAQLVSTIKEKEDLAESFNAYKAETEKRLMQSTKEYAKLSLKLKKYKIGMYNALAVNK